MPFFERLLITGAAGDLGAALRKDLAPLATSLRLTDRADLGAAAAHEELIQAELSDMDAVMKMTRDVDMIVHFGGASRERVWEDVLDSTIRGSYNIYEAARKNNVRRVVFASSIHSVGFHPVENGIDTTADHMPDTLYGVSKCFVEDLAKLYWHKWQIETVCLRICSCFPEPANYRMLGSWLSYRDMSQLVERSLLAPRVGHSVIYGVSDNREPTVSNRLVGHIGYRPVDSAEPFRAKVMAEHAMPDPHINDTKFVGGYYAAFGHPDEEPAQ